jgi:hypothetical protein
MFGVGFGSGYPSKLMGWVWRWNCRSRAAYRCRAVVEVSGLEEVMMMMVGFRVLIRRPILRGRVKF